MWSGSGSEYEQFPEISKISSEVLTAIKQVIPSNDPLDRTDFEVVSYINSSFPTEQSLAGLGDVIAAVEEDITATDNEIRGFVRDQTVQGGQDGVSTLTRAQASIEALVAKVSDMKGRAEQSEAAVRDMTRDIRQLDTAKRNLTVAITTLNHLNMLVSGADTLKMLVTKRQYGDTANLLQGVANVLEHFDDYHNIPQILLLSQQVAEIKRTLGDQISLEFREVFSSQAGTMNIKQMSEACLVLDVLEPHIKHDLLQWFVQIQLKEYSVLFEENEDSAWLDKIDKRYSWLKKHLIQFEERYSSIFPVSWDVSQRIALQFCHQTRQDLARVMGKRRHEIDVKLLLTAIQKTCSFENLLFLRFGGHALEDSVDPTFSAGSGYDDEKNPFIERTPPAIPIAKQVKAEKEKKPIPNQFYRVITQSYDPFLYIYIDSQDKNLMELIEKFAVELKVNGFPTPQVADASAIVLSNCADLFVFYKKCLVQCTQLSCGEPLLNLGHVFSKRLREYCNRILQANLPRISMSSPAMASVTTITRELRDLSTTGLMQNFQSFLKEGEAVRYSRQELYRISCILTTAEYCVETTQQLEEKLKEKLGDLAGKLTMDGEKNLFADVIEACVGVLVQDLYAACEPVLASMNKTNWQMLETVGDQSAYVSAITSQWRLTVPTLRDFLTTSRKYFVLFCQQFARLFMSKFVSTLYKCKGVSKPGAQQLLLDTQSLKTGLLDLPSIGLTVKRKPPDKYSKLIVREMGRTEMILKIVMAPAENAHQFVDHATKLVPDCDLGEFTKILDMKGIKKIEQTPFSDEFKIKSPGISLSTNANTSSEPSAEFSRIKKLEKLIKKRL